jgi:hypothetical protein
MKNILIILLVLINFTKSFSQQNNSISVQGETEYNIEKAKSYVAYLQLKELKSDSYSNFEDKSLELVREQLKVKLEGIGLNFNDLIENKTLFFYSSYSDPYKSMYYTFKTSSELEFTKLLSVKMVGLTMLNVEINSEKLTPEETSKLALRAIENAREKAQKIAEKLNKKVGDIISITDQNYSAVPIGYYNNENNIYSVNVNFNLL